MARPLRIALIEGDDLIRQLASRWLSAMGYDVHCATAQRIGDGRHALIIADIAHPRKAAAVARLIRAGSDAPILLVSARFHRSQGASSELATQLGVAAILAKPYSKDELQAAVVAALDQSADRPP